MKSYRPTVRLLAALLCCVLAGGFTLVHGAAEPRDVSARELLTKMTDGAPFEYENIRVTCGADESLDLRQLFEAGSSQVEVKVEIKIVNSEIDCPITTGGTSTHFQKYVNFANTRFLHDVFLANAVFDHTVNFNNATFDRGAVFDGSTFNAPAVFDKAKFAPDCDTSQAACASAFLNTTFLNSTSFFGAAFKGSLQDLFRDTIFSGETSFEKAEFSTPTYFVNTSFPGEVDFSQAVFENDVRFTEATFSNIATFREAHFNKRLFVTGSTALGSVDFSQAEFIGEARFEESAFTKPVVFWDTRFFSPATFRRVTFADTVDFTRGDFVVDVLFQDITFSLPAFFRGVDFTNVSFLSSTFSDKADFTQADFQENARFGGLAFAAPVLFRSAEFFGTANFADITFDDEVNFSQATFTDALRFEEVEAVASMLFRGVYFGGPFVFRGSVYDALDLTGIKMRQNEQLSLFMGEYESIVVSYNFNFDWLTVPNEPNLQTEAIDFFAMMETSTRQQGRPLLANEALFRRQEAECQITAPSLPSVHNCVLGSILGHGVRLVYVLSVALVVIVLFWIAFWILRAKRKQHTTETVNLRLPYEAIVADVSERHLVVVANREVIAVQNGTPGPLERLFDWAWEPLALSFLAFTSLRPVKWQCHPENSFAWARLVAVLVALEWAIGWYALLWLVATLYNTIPLLGSVLSQLR
jgi:uncharacterized protein YjbI with pentapeptide repeats